VESYLTIHLAIVAVEFLCLILVYWIIRKVRRRLLQKSLRKFPPRRLALEASDMTRTMYVQVLEQFVKQEQLPHAVRPSKRDAADKGCDRNDECDRHVHHRQEIALQWHNIETAACSYDRSLRRKKNQTVREYLHSLVDLAGGGEASFRNNVEDYLTYYELAKFSDREFDARSFGEVMKIVLALIQNLEGNLGRRSRSSPATPLGPPADHSPVKPSSAHLHHLHHYPDSDTSHGEQGRRRREGGRWMRPRRAHRDKDKGRDKGRERRRGEG